MLNRVVDMLVERKMFLRQRKKDRTRVLGMLLYHLGLSLRETREILSASFEPVSHETVRQWYLRMGEMIESLEKKERKAIAIDETKVRMKGKWIYLWAAIDLETREILAVYVSTTRTCLETHSFLRKIMKYCTNKPYVYVDGGPWYPWALTRLGFKWEHKTFGPRNPIEQWFGTLKRRITRFYKSFNTTTNVWNTLKWFKSYQTAYNLIWTLS